MWRKNPKHFITKTILERRIEHFGNTIFILKKHGFTQTMLGEEGKPRGKVSENVIELECIKIIVEHIWR